MRKNRKFQGRISRVAVGQQGSLTLAALPGESLPLVVERITPIAVSEEGRNFFPVEARLGEGGDLRARQPLDPCVPFVGDRFIQRTCVRSADWLAYLNAIDIEGAERQIIGTARSMGVDVEGVSV